MVAVDRSPPPEPGHHRPTTGTIWLARSVRERVEVRCGGFENPTFGVSSNRRTPRG